MITPDNELPPDDSEEFDAEDQQSQQDIHSNGLEETPVFEESPDTDILKQSYDASESAYTLKLDEDKPPAKKEE
jgi:hypothetical protein